MNKKSQVTVFVILGLIILIAVGIVIFLQIRESEDKPDVPDEIASKEIAPVREFVESCVYGVTKKGIKEIGRHSGYTETPEGLSINPIPYESEVFYNDIYMMPYWYYLDDGNFLSNRPHLCSYTSECLIDDYGDNNVQENIENYVLDNIDNCLNDFKEFEHQFKVTPKSEKDSFIQIINGSVISRFNYKLEISPSDKENISVNIENFQTELNVPLLQMFDLATEITESQSKYNFLDQNTLNLISAYVGLDEDKLLPPMGEMVFFEMGKKIWFQSQVKDKLRYEVLPYIGLTRLTNALGTRESIPLVEEEYLPFALGYYDSFKAKLDNDNTTYNQKVKFYYPDSDIFLEIDDGDELIEPKSTEAPGGIITNMFNIVVQDYRFDYDLSYPVIVEIEDPFAFEGEGFTFAFPLEVNIRNNIPYSENMTFTSIPRISEINLDDPDQLVNRTITIKVEDRHTDEPVNNARITYYCGSDYYIGETSLHHGEAVYEGKLPYCALGGHIEVRKDDYHTEKILFNNDESDLSSETVEAGMWPIKNKTIGFFTRTEEDIDNMSTISDKLTKKHELKSNQKLIFNIERKKDSAIEETFPLVGFKAVAKENATEMTSGIESQKQNIEMLYDHGEINQSMYESLIEQLEEHESAFNTSFGTLSSTITNMDLIPGTYTVEMTMMADGPFNIPEKTETICVIEEELTGICLEEEEITYDATNFSTWITGKTTFNFSIGENYVYNDKIINFFVPVIDEPETWDDIIEKDIDSYMEEEVDEWMINPYYE